MFTKEHYVEIAEMLKNSIHDRRISHFALVQDFIELFRKNPKFDVNKFLDVIYGREEDKCEKE